MKRPALRWFRDALFRKNAKRDVVPETVPTAAEASRLPALHCRWCGQDHSPIELKRGQRAICVRCRSVIARKSWAGPDAMLAFTLAGLVFAVPAALLPLATLSKFGNQHASFLFSGIVALWRNGMPWLSVWTALCGAITPILLLGVLAGYALPGRFGWVRDDRHTLVQAAHALEHWAMPEVHILAVLVSFVKLGALVNVTPGPGLWCYAAMSLCILAAWRSFELDPSLAHAIPARPEVAS